MPQAPETPLDVAPGSTNEARPLSLDPQARVVILTLDLSSRDACIGTLERIGRAVLAGRIDAARHRMLIVTVRTALEAFTYRRAARGEVGKAAAEAEAGARIAADPDGGIDEEEEERTPKSVEPDRQPTFEERVRAARAAEARAAGKASAAGATGAKGRRAGARGR